MQIPVDISFRNMDHDDKVEEAIHQRVGKLESYCDWIVGCHVVVESPHHSHRKGSLFNVRIHMTVPPRGDIAVNREQHENHGHEDVYIAIRDAFNAARRQLKTFVRENREIDRAAKRRVVSGLKD